MIEEPRVWLDGEEIPQHVRVIDKDGEIYWPGEDDEPGTTSSMWGFGPVVEVPLPNWCEAVHRDRERRPDKYDKSRGAL